ncbi:HET-domain-containing protein [Didymella exigua CBS 183.55]|uniref:HET-domain-containing protein n=1 Tax=Didymella exigua CBS 183.55 TaxID=1150837 RepID=A0A6A5RW81_9PLEO|nr:HET-domain-containing protein [Didymella exigua CBS 183.55]KAF1929537.1 HET-domain-containing protein [Didymella exigua CBS 183.55]
MALCDACQLIPIREFLRFFGGDRSLLRDLIWWKDPSASRGTEEPFFRWHVSLQHLRANAKECPFCHFTSECLQASLRMRANEQYDDRRAVWLRFPTSGNNQFHIFLGDEQPAVLVSGRILFTTTPDSPVAQYLDVLEVIPDSLHPAVLGKLDRWIQMCASKHSDCSGPLECTRPLPTRLLDLRGLPERQEIIENGTDWRKLFEDRSCRLIETTSGSVGEYVALSYCWGKSVPCTTRKDNIQKHKEEQGLSFADLPGTLQDAAFLVRYLGLRYMWADCLCIVQDDETDWQNEAGRMSEVYSNASLTLAAMRASQCTEGFLQPRTGSNHILIKFNDDEGAFTLYFEYSDDTMSPGAPASTIDGFPLRYERDEPMMSRGWCFQERVLARRTIHFTQRQMYWECEEGLFWECLDTEKSTNLYDEYSIRTIGKGLVQSLSRTATDVQQPWFDRKPWFNVVQEYTSRNITYHSDKLPALSGIAAALQRVTGDVCYAGLWHSWFVQGLLWRFQDSTIDPYIQVPKKTEKVVEWRAPTWSFAALEGVAVYAIYDAYASTCATLEECTVVPKGNNTLGELTSAFARVNGPLTCITHVEQSVGINGRVCKIWRRGRDTRRATVRFDLDYYDACDVLMVTPCSGLAIVPDAGKTHTYKRVGIVEAYRDDGQRDGVALSTTLTAADWPAPTSVVLL